MVIWRDPQREAMELLMAAGMNEYLFEIVNKPVRCC